MEKIKLTHRKARGKKGPRYLLRCGDCDEKIEIYYDEKSLEIGGVMGSLDNWREILLPLLRAHGVPWELVGERREAGEMPAYPGEVSCSQCGRKLQFYWPQKQMCKECAGKEVTRMLGQNFKEGI